MTQTHLSVFPSVTICKGLSHIDSYCLIINTTEPPGTPRALPGSNFYGGVPWEFSSPVDGAVLWTLHLLPSLLGLPWSHDDAVAEMLLPFIPQ